MSGPVQIFGKDGSPLPAEASITLTVAEIRSIVQQAVDAGLKATPAPVDQQEEERRLLESMLSTARVLEQFRVESASRLAAARRPIPAAVVAARQSDVRLRKS